MTVLIWNFFIKHFAILQTCLWDENECSSYFILKYCFIEYRRNNFGHSIILPPMAAILACINSVAHIVSLSLIFSVIQSFHDRKGKLGLIPSASADNMLSNLSILDRIICFGTELLHQRTSPRECHKSARSHLSALFTLLDRRVFYEAQRQAARDLDLRIRI